jgi:hypothetical protein
MSKSKLRDFERTTTNKLLKELLKAYNSSTKISQDDKVTVLVTKLDDIFKKRIKGLSNASNTD